MRAPLNAILADLRRILTGRVVIVGVGNRWRGDDGAGCALIDRAAERTSAVCLDAGVAPENFLEKAAAARPDTVLFVDAASFAGDAGEIRIFTPDQIAPAGLSTHALSLKMAAEYLKVRTGARIYMAGIQAGTREPGETLSPPVEDAVAELSRALEEACPHA
jgi:hydrogenase maturation protease